MSVKGLEGANTQIRTELIKFSQAYKSSFSLLTFPVSYDTTHSNPLTWKNAVTPLYRRMSILREY